MSKRVFDKIKAGLDAAEAYLDGTGDKRRYRVHVPETVDVKKIRARLGPFAGNLCADLRLRAFGRT